MVSRPLLAISLCFLASLIHAGEMVTLKAFTPESQVSPPLVLAEGEGVKFLATSYRGTSSLPAVLQVTFTGDQNPLVIDLSDATFQGFALQGPATITYKRPSNVARAFATFDVTFAPELTPAIPAAAVVIPEDANGQFQVILESTTNGVDWTQTQPGLYGGSTVKRFFRTRILRTN